MKTSKITYARTHTHYFISIGFILFPVFSRSCCCLSFSLLSHNTPVLTAYLFSSCLRSDSRKMATDVSSFPWLFLLLCLLITRSVRHLSRSEFQTNAGQRCRSDSHGSAVCFLNMFAVATSYGSVYALCS